MDTTDLNPLGWYPGKKHSWKKRLGQVATLGIYNPDNRFASDLNKEQLKKRALDDEDRHDARLDHAAALEQMTKNLVNVGIAPEEAARLANEAFASKVVAGVASNKARTAQDQSDEKKWQGYGVHAGAIGLDQGAQDRAAAAAETARNRNIQTEAEVAAAMGVPRRRVVDEIGGFDAAVEERANQSEMRGIASEQRRQDAAEGWVVREQTYDDRIKKAAADAAAGRAASEATANLLRDPAAAERAARLRQNREMALPVNAGDAVANVPFPDAGGEIKGPPVPLRPAGDLSGYELAEEVQDPDDPTRKIVLRKVRVPLGQQNPLTAPRPAAAPTVSPSGKTIKIIGQ